MDNFRVNWIKGKTAFLLHCRVMLQGFLNSSLESYQNPSCHLTCKKPFSKLSSWEMRRKLQLCCCRAWWQTGPLKLWDTFSTSWELCPWGQCKESLSIAPSALNDFSFQATAVTLWQVCGFKLSYLQLLTRIQSWSFLSGIQSIFSFCRQLDFVPFFHLHSSLKSNRTDWLN